MSHPKSKLLAQNWQGVLSTYIEQAEQEARSVKRKGKLTVQQLVQTLVLGGLEKAEISLTGMAQTAEQLGVKVTPTSINERICGRLVVVMMIVLEQCLKMKCDGLRMPIKRLTVFRAVHIIDSTQITVSEKLYEIFRGNGKNAKMKVHLVFDYLTGQIHALDCVAGRRPDQKCELLPDVMHKDNLLLFDLGYFVQETLAAITATQAFFVTRCQSQVALYDAQTGDRIHLADGLKQTPLSHLTWAVRLGARVRTPVRVVARRLPQQQADARRRHAKAKAKDQGKTCTQAYLLQLGWDILVTNLDDQWTVDDVMRLYRVRWQIEIVFKGWKSLLGIDQLGNWREARVLCQFYARLIAIFLCHRTIGICNDVTSYLKAIPIIQCRIGDLLSLIRRHWWGVHRWAHHLRLALLRFAQHDKRKTMPTTRQLLMDWG